MCPKFLYENQKLFVTFSYFFSLKIGKYKKHMNIYINKINSTMKHNIYYVTK